jgi:hypothetical protein
MEQVPQFMRKESEPLVRASVGVVQGGLVPFAPVLRDRAGDRDVQTAVEQPKVVRADRHVLFGSQLGDGLTDVAIVMHHLRQGQSLQLRVVAVQERTPVNLSAGRQAETDRRNQLIQKEGDAVVDFRVRRWWHRPRGHLGSAAQDDFVPVYGNEFTEHEAIVVHIVGPR